MGADLERGGAARRSQRSGRRLPALRDTALLAALAVSALAAWQATASAGGGASAPVELLPEGPKLVATGEVGEGRFGRGVALSADGATAIVGGPRDSSETGAAWIFTHTPSGWSQQTELSVGRANQSGFFGRGVAISADGTTALVGDPGNSFNRGAAWVFVRSGAAWTLQGKLEGSGETGAGQFGRSVALSADGSTAIVGAFADDGDAGAAWVFRRAGGSWTKPGTKLTAAEALGPALFGRSVALSADGATALVGGNGDDRKAGAAWVFTRAGEEWTPGPKLTGVGESGAGEFGTAVALDGEGTTALVGGADDAGGAGAAWVFARTGSAWSQQAGKLLADDETGAGQLGYSVALSADGSVALAGGPADAMGTGAAWVFQPSRAGWAQVGAKLTGAGEVGAGAFGIGVALGGRRALVGGNDDAGDTGAAWPYAQPAAPEPAAEANEQPKASSPVGPSQGVLASTFSSVPLLGQTGNVAPLSGHVRVRLPHSDVFVALTELRAVPFGTLIDATAGHVLVSAALPGTATEQGEFFAGEFLLTQTRNGVVTATLAGGSRSACRSPSHHHRGVRRARAARSKRPVRKLWANAHGTFTTKGSYAAGAVQGTEWLTEDRCDGTFIRVTRDKVRVTDLVHHRSFVVRAGHSVLVRAG